MDIMELGAIGELVGGVAVIASLVYVGIQVKNSAQEQKLASMRETSSQIGASYNSLSLDSEMAAIYLQGLRDFQSLEPPHALRFSVIAVQFCRIFEHAFYQHRDGRSERQVWNGLEGQLHDFVAYPGFQSWWSNRRHWFGEDFRAFVDSRATPENVPQLWENHGEREGH